MSEEMKLCKNCSFFIYSSKHCGRSKQTPDYVFGEPSKTITAQTEREMVTTGCGPSAKFFMPIVPADYAEAMIRKDQQSRHEGRPEHDLDIVSRAMKAGH